MTKITYEQTKAAAQTVVDRAPRVKNPFVRNRMTDTVDSLYTDVKDPNRHCLGASILIELGLPIPTENEFIVSGPNSGMFTEAAERLLDRLVGTADYGTENPRYKGDYRLEWKTTFNRVTALEEDSKFDGHLIGEGED